MDTAEVTQREAKPGVPRDTFQARLILARLHAGDLTIRDAAARCGLNYGSWANWESGVKPRDKIETAQAISEGLGVDYDWLLHGGPLVREERPVRVLARLRKDERAAAQPNVFYLTTPERTVQPTDRVVGAQPTPASQGSPRLPTVRNPRQAGRTADPRRTAAAAEQRRTRRRHRPAS